MVNKAKAKEDTFHPSRDESGRFEGDARPRRAGFKIHQRKKGREPIWVGPDGVPVGQAEAFRLLALSRAQKREEARICPGK